MSAAAAPRAAPVRIYADPIRAAELMRRLVGNPQLDARLGQKDGRSYVELRAPALDD